MRTGTRDEERRQASRQVTALVVAMSVVVGVTIWTRHAPADASELRILIGELRSQAAELEVLAGEEAAGKLGEAFMREHARQLAKINRNSFRELARLRVEQSLETEKSGALTDGGELAMQFKAFDSAQPVMSQTRLREIRQALQNRETALRP